jgi:hypothetical protein
MAVNFVKGQILSGILERDGIDLSIANANVGINTNSPTVALDVNGNIRANNLRANTANIVGNVTVGNISTIGNIAGGNVLTDHLCYANGTPWDLQEPAGSNTQIQFNNNSQFGANANFTFSTAANLLTVNATANIANVTVPGNIAGGNVLFGNGIVSGSGNIYGGNIISGNAVIGNIQVSGDVTVNSLTSNTYISAIGNVVSGNVQTTGSISATGNITGGNLAIVNNISANTANITGNVTVGNVSTVGNVTAGNVLTNHLLYANGAPWDLQEPAGSNTQIQFNNNSQFGATANFTFDTATNLLTVNATANIANVNVSGAAIVAGNVTGGNLITGGLATVTGNVTGGNIVTKGIVTSQPGQPLILTPALGQNADLVSSDGKNAFYVNETAAYIQTVDVSNNVSLWTFNTSGNLSAPGNISAVGNVTGGNVLTGGYVSAVGNITGNNLYIGDKIIPSAGNINAGQSAINNLLNPYSQQDAATKYYVDQSIANIATTNQTLNGDGTTTTFTLNRSTTTAAALIMLNGITQIPDQSYAMTPSPSTNLVFTEAPQTGDIIDIRFL